MVHIKDLFTRISGLMSFMAQQPDESADHSQDDYSVYT